MPASMAAASVNGLNVEPGWRWPCAKLNCVFLNLEVDVMATISPVEGRIETSAAAGSQEAFGAPEQGGSLSTPRIALYASFCICGSMVVVTLRPPPSTACAPNSVSLSSWDRTYCSTYGSVVRPNRSPRFKPSFEADASANSSCV